MKKPFKPLFKTAAVAFSALVMLCGFCLTGHDAEIKADAASRVDLNYLMNKFPDGKYWNHVGKKGNNADGYTDKPCHHALSGGLYRPVGTCNSFYGIQCWGFVNKLANECYGTANHSSWPRTTLSKLKPGDAIRFKHNSHSIFVTGVDGEIVTYGECNGNYSDCKIRWNVQTTKSQIARSLTAVYSAPSELIVNLSNRSAIQKNEISFGEKVYIQGSAIGGDSKYQYQFSVKKPSEKSFGIVQKFSSSDRCSYFPWTKGSYKVKVTVRDGSGKTSDKILDFNVSADEVVNKSKINRKAIRFGENISFSFDADGGTKCYQYRIRALKPTETEYAVIKNFSRDSSFSYHPWESGIYRIKVDAKDGSGTIRVKEFTFTVKADKLKNKTTASAGSIVYGEDITFDLAAAGGTSGYVYEIKMIKPGSRNYVTLRNYRSGKEFVYHPWEKGEYQFKVTVRDLSYHISTVLVKVNVTE